MIGCHLIFGAYGFWLPNDPRGSWSTEVWARHLRPFGGPTKVETRHSVAHRKHDRAERLRAKQALKYPAVKLTGIQARAAGRGFAQIIDELKVTVYACAVLPDHVHLVTAAHRPDGDELIGFLKRAATRHLSAEALHPLEAFRRGDGRVPSPWAVRGWTVYLDTVEQMRRRIRYVEENPLEAGLPRQRWPFVSTYGPGLATGANTLENRKPP
jgi:REP element-mobilizing transposase RayT